MSEEIFQNAIARVYDAVKNTVGVVDENATIIACSEPGMMGGRLNKIPESGLYDGNIFEQDGYTYGKITSDTGENDSYWAFIHSTGNVAVQHMKLVILVFEEIKKHNDEKQDKSTFLKGVILDNILPGDIFLRAREMNFNANVNRVCMLLKVEEHSNVLAFDVLSSIFPDKNKDFIINLNEYDIAIIKEIDKDIEMSTVEELAKTITATLSKKYYVKGCIGIGSITKDLKDLATSFKEAQVALEIGKVFDTEQDVINYDKLGIARLIYQVPTTICEMFLKEVFKKNRIDALDDETLFTIRKFFENNLNVSETARKLFIHRNTLVYRLEKIFKLTGLDLRQFEHAILFKVAMMVEKYLQSSPIDF